MIRITLIRILHRSLVGNVASLVMSGSDSVSSSSLKSDTSDTTIMGVESLEGEILELSSPVSVVLVCWHIFVMAATSGMAIHK